MNLFDRSRKIRIESCNDYIAITTTDQPFSLVTVMPSLLSRGLAMMPVTRSTSVVLSLAISMICLLVLPSVAHAQAVAIAEISGSVSDQSGSALVNAQVRATEVEKQIVRSTVTDQTGRYVLSNLPVGPYKLEVQANGFKDYVQSGIILQVGQSATLNVVMQVGSLSEKIEVTAQTAMVETHENGITQVIDEKRINDLPLNGRQATPWWAARTTTAPPPYPSRAASSTAPLISSTAATTPTL